MSHTDKQSGFTVIELLITLFVAAAFLVAGFQLYNAIIKDGGQTRSESRATNVAYDYLRRYSVSATNPCTVLTPLTNSSLTVTGLSAVTVTVAISCPYAATTNVSKIDVSVIYNSPQQTVKYSTYVKR
jgi:prepilin-type N-terminal cleavage/methylation domain-containing protein